MNMKNYLVEIKVKQEVSIKMKENHVIFKIIILEIHFNQIYLKKINLYYQIPKVFIIKNQKVKWVFQIKIYHLKKNLKIFHLILVNQNMVVNKIKNPPFNNIIINIMNLNLIVL